MTLKDLKPGQSGRITVVGGEGALRQHFLDMGVIPGAEVTMVRFAPMGDPMELRIHDYELTLRLADAGCIQIDHPYEKEKGRGHHRRGNRDRSEHPGLGEGGRFHPPGSGEPLPDDTVLSFALVGNQNCGKTTLFNQLTGANQHVGNFPGVTIDRKSGTIRRHPNTLVTDLPGSIQCLPTAARSLCPGTSYSTSTPTPSSTSWTRPTLSETCISPCSCLR